VEGGHTNAGAWVFCCAAILLGALRASHRKENVLIEKQVRRHISTRRRIIIG
jgi:hypothetical protein